MPDTLTASIAAMSDHEVEVRLSIRTGLCAFDTGTDSANWEQDYRNPTLPMWFRQIRYLINPLESPGPWNAPGGFCGEEDFIGWGESLASGWTPPGGSIRERANGLLHWFWTHDP